MGARSRFLLAGFLAVAVAASLLVVVAAERSARAAVALPKGFHEKTVISGLHQPTSVEFAKDGRVFVAEKSGLIKVFETLDDPVPSVYADLRKQVYNFWDKGLLGMALHPSFPQDPRMFVLYSRNAVVGGPAPRWPSPNGTDDVCPSPPGATEFGCLGSARLSVLRPKSQAQAGQDGAPMNERALIDDWCSQFPVHTIGTVAFGRDGMLYVGGGDGAHLGYADYGQKSNACGDPDKPAGKPLKRPTAQGGSLHAQDVRTPKDPTTLSGSIIRVDPGTGKPARGNPTKTGDVNARRIVAYGMRNPFRFTMRPGTNDLWLGDVAPGGEEEINRIPDPKGKPRNFGWPCYIGKRPAPGFQPLKLDMCKKLYAEGPRAVTGPYFAYSRARKVTPRENCPAGTAALAGLAFYQGGGYPAGYRGALFFTDYSRRCIWTMTRGKNGLPDPKKVQPFATRGGALVELQTGPGGDIFGVDIAGGRIVRYVYNANNNPPSAAIRSDVTSGKAPLTVTFDGQGSTDADGHPLSYSWDLDGDGRYGDATGPTASREYLTRGKVLVGLLVTDGHGGTDRATTAIYPDSTPPEATITAPAPGVTWKVGDKINFSGTGVDAEDGTLGGGSLDWQVIMHHCPNNICHDHQITGSSGAGGRITAPDHENPSWLELRLTVTDKDGQSDTKSLELRPQDTALTLASVPPGIPLTLFDQTRAAPNTWPVITGSVVSLAAPTQTVWLKGYPYRFVRWSNGGPSAHTVKAPPGAATYTATFRRLANLALGRPVRASSAQGPDLRASNAVDGNPTTRWSSQYRNGQFIQVDLGSQRRISRTVLHWDAAFAKRFSIETSVDGRRWTRAFSTRSGDGDIDNVRFAPRSARYVRMNGQVRATRWGFSLWEFAVYAN